MDCFSPEHNTEALLIRPKRGYPGYFPPNIILSVVNKRGLACWRKYSFSMVLYEIPSYENTFPIEKIIFHIFEGSEK